MSDFGSNLSDGTKHKAEIFAALGSKTSTFLLQTILSSHFISIGSRFAVTCTNWLEGDVYDLSPNEICGTYIYLGVGSSGNLLCIPIHNLWYPA